MDRFNVRAVLLASFALASAVACTTPPPAGDAAPADGPTPDATAPDVADRPYNSPLFGRCRTSADCAFGATCKTEGEAGWSNGFCTRECSSASDCVDGVASGTSGYCGTQDGQRICMRECLNGFDCGRPGFTCLQIDPNDRSMTPRRSCRPSCSETSCVQGNRCNPWTGKCQPQSAPFPPAGQDVGQSCMQMGTMNNCRSGECVPAQTTTGTYTGWNNGYCTSNCTLPAGWNNSTLWPENTFPQSNCPMGSVCFPDGDPGIAEQDPGTCYRGCTTDNDCRAMEGFYCRKTFNRGNGRPFTWQNGICLPRPCDPAPTAMNTCPANYYCEGQVRVQGTMRVTVGVCRPGMRPGPEPTVEAGVPSDAATDSGARPDVAVDAGADVAADATVITDATVDASTDAAAAD
jgi:hypothetical protein